MALGAELLQLWPSYLAYVVSFLVIGAIWINHHAMFQHIVRVDGTLLLLNVLHLMLICIPAVPNRRACRSVPSWNRRTDCCCLLWWNFDRNRYLRQHHMVVRRKRASVSRHSPHGEKGTANWSAVPPRSEHLRDRHTDRAGYALAGTATLPSPQHLLSLASPESRDRPVPHRRSDSTSVLIQIRVG